MFKKSFSIIIILIVAIFANSCENADKKTKQKKPAESTYKMAKYADFKLTTDISHLSDNQKEMLLLLFKAADLTDEIFWMQNVSEKMLFYQVLKMWL